MAEAETQGLWTCVSREEVEALAASDDELPRRAGLALKALIEDVAKAQASAASTAINTGARAHTEPRRDRSICLLWRKES